MRSELPARNSGSLWAVPPDRQTAVEVDLTEVIAGKKALEKAAAQVAERFLPKLVKK